MSFCEGCETDWIFGAKGKCASARNRICECPPGFNGVDFWFDAEDCHANFNTRRTLYIFLSVFFSIALISITATFYIFQKFHKKEKSISSIFLLSKRTFENETEKREARSIRMMHALIIISGIVCALYLLESLFFAFKPSTLRKFEVPYVQSLVYAIVLTLLPNYVHLSTYFLFLYLPDPKAYGQLIGLSRVIIKFPHFCRRYFYFNIIVSPSSFIFLAILGPLEAFNGEQKAYLHAAIAIFYILNTITLFALSLYIYNLKKLYSSLLETTFDEDTVKEMKTTMRILFWLFWLAVNFITTNLVFILYIIVYGTYTYVLVAISQIQAISAFCIINGIGIYYIFKGVAPFKVRSAPQRLLLSNKE